MNMFVKLFDGVPLEWLVASFGNKSCRHCSDGLIVETIEALLDNNALGIMDPSCFTRFPGWAIAMGHSDAPGIHISI